MRASSPRRETLASRKAQDSDMFGQTFKVYVYQKGLLYRYGKLESVLDAGKHQRWGSGWEVRPVDMRRRDEVVALQEILTQDGLGVRLSAICSYSVENPEKAVHSVEDFKSAAYSIVQLAMRDAVAGQTAEDLLARRGELGGTIQSACAEKFQEIGLKLSSLNIRDISLPGDLKKAFAQVVLAQKEAMASLERARGEMASLRSLANAAKMLENNPALLQLRILQSISEAKGATIVLGAEPRVLNGSSQSG